MSIINGKIKLKVLYVIKTEKIYI